MTGRLLSAVDPLGLSGFSDFSSAYVQGMRDAGKQMLVAFGKQAEKDAGAHAPVKLATLEPTRAGVRESVSQQVQEAGQNVVAPVVVPFALIKKGAKEYVEAVGAARAGDYGKAGQGAGAGNVHLGTGVLLGAALVETEGKTGSFGTGLAEETGDQAIARSLKRTDAPVRPSTVASPPAPPVADAPMAPANDNGTGIAANQNSKPATSPLLVDTSPPVAANANNGGGPYAHLQDHPSVGPGKDYTQTQKANILESNSARNGGALRDDRTGEILVESSQSKEGVTPPTNEAQVDHVYPKSRGGSNSYGNAEVRSRGNNSNKKDSL